MSKKNGLLLIAFLLCLFHLNAQEKNNFAIGIEIGAVASSAFNGGGVLFHLEPKFGIIENGAVGLRLGGTFNSRGGFENQDFQFNIDSQFGSGAISLMPTFDYYFIEAPFRPYAGLGIGYYSLGNVDVTRSVIVNPNEDVFEADLKGQLGFLLRGGFKLHWFTLTLEYNLVPQADIETPDGQFIGKAIDSYWGLSIGFRIGGDVD